MPSWGVKIPCFVRTVSSSNEPRSIVVTCFKEPTVQIKRKFTQAGADVFASFKYRTHDCVIMDHKTGKPSFEFKGAEVPEKWDKNACDVLVSKYFRKGGVPQTVAAFSEQGVTPTWLCPSRSVGGVTGSEQSVKEVVRRMVGHWTYTGYQNGYFDPTPEQITEAGVRNHDKNKQLLKEENARAYYDEMCFMLLSDLAAPNSPQFFNTGLWWAYGIEGPAQGHYFVDLPANIDLANSSFPSAEPIDDVKARLKKQGLVRQSSSAYQRVQAHACFILGVEDTLLSANGIIPWIEREARIFKYGSGSGTNLSKLRGTNESLSGGGKSSGLMSWIESADRSAGAIKSGGTTRRAAKMVCVNLDHPDSERFINCKTEAEVSGASMVVGSHLVKKHCQGLVDVAIAYGCRSLEDALANGDINDLVVEAPGAGVLDNYIHKAILLGTPGVTEWPDYEFNTSFNSRAYEIAPYQNANNSVRIPTSFYRAVDSGGMWNLTSRTTKETIKEFNARELDAAIASAAWFSGDPRSEEHTSELQSRQYLV